MKKIVLTQEQVDKLVVVDRVVVEPSVCGVGRVDVPFKISNGGKHFWQYQLWNGMLDRCFSEKFKGRNPTYMNVTCCDEWLSFGNFVEWVNKEVGYAGKPEGMELDKDLIIRGNKAYSPETCSFVPKSINLLLGSNKASRGEWPVGVRLHKRSGKFDARMSCGNGKRKHLGLFLTPEDAFAVYKIAKEAQIKVVALRYRDVIKPAVFDLLMAWEVD